MSNKTSSPKDDDSVTLGYTIDENTTITNNTKNQAEKRNRDNIADDIHVIDDKEVPDKKRKMGKQSIEHVYNITEFKSWTKEQVSTLLRLKDKNGGASLADEKVKSLYEAKFDGNSIGVIIDDLKVYPKYTVVDEVQKSFITVPRDTIKTVINWVIVLVEKRLYHLWSAEQFAKNLETIVGLSPDQSKVFIDANFNGEKAKLFYEDVLQTDLTTAMKNHNLQDESACRLLIDWISSQSITVTSLITEWLDNTLKISSEFFEPLKYSYCCIDSPYVKRESALKKYLTYVSSTLAKKDTKTSTAATVMFIGDCPGVGKSRFAYELPAILNEEFNKQQQFHFINLAIWFNSGYNPTVEESRDNLILSTAARMIFSYITHVRPHSYKGIIPPLGVELKTFYGTIYNDLQQSILPNNDILSIVISWILKKESQYTELPIWIHLTIDEYNQPFQHIKDEIIIDNWCSAISNIHHSFKTSSNVFTNLLTGTHGSTMLNLKSGGMTFLTRIPISRFNTEENYLLYKQMGMPYDTKLLNSYLTMGGHARLCVEFITQYFEQKDEKNISLILKTLQGIIGSSPKDRFQLCLDEEEIEFLLCLCFTGITISKDYRFKNTQILQYQRNNIVFMKEIDDETVSIEIPLLVISKMLKKLSSKSFLNQLGNTIERWETYNNNFENFENFNYEYLQIRLKSFQKLKQLKVIDKQITLKDLFTIDIDFQDHIIALESSNYSLNQLSQQYPITKGITITPNVIYKNGVSAPFADIFSILSVHQPTNNQILNVFCYLQIKHTTKKGSVCLDYENDIKPELLKLEKGKEGIKEPILVLFISNRRYPNQHLLTNDSQSFSVIHTDNGKHYFGPFYSLFHFHTEDTLIPIKELSLDMLKYILGGSGTRKKQFRYSTLKSEISSAEANEIPLVLNRYCDKNMLQSLRHFVKEKDIIDQTLKL